MQGKVEAVLFDLGDTLVSTEASLAGALMKLVDAPLAISLKLDYESLKALGQSIEGAIQDFYAVKRLDQPDWLPLWQQSAEACDLNISTESMNQLARAHLKKFVAEAEVMPYSIPLLSALNAKGIPLGLVSNMTGPREIFDDDLRQKGLAEYFDTVVWSCAAGVRKPSSEIFLTALDKLNLKPSSRILMVGDNEIADVQGGNAMGFTTIKIVKGTENQLSEADSVMTGWELLAEFG